MVKSRIVGMHSVCELKYIHFSTFLYRCQMKATLVLYLGCKTVFAMPVSCMGFHTCAISWTQRMEAWKSFVFMWHDHRKISEMEVHHTANLHTTYCVPTKHSCRIIKRFQFEISDKFVIVLIRINFKETNIIMVHITSHMFSDIFPREHVLAFKLRYLWVMKKNTWQAIIKTKISQVGEARSSQNRTRLI